MLSAMFSSIRARSFDNNCCWQHDSGAAHPPPPSVHDRFNTMSGHRDAADGYRHDVCETSSCYWWTPAWHFQGMVMDPARLRYIVDERRHYILWKHKLKVSCISACIS